MKPSASPPNDAAPAAWVVARAVPKPVAASGEALPGSTQRRIRHSSSTPSTSGTCTPPSAPASASQRSPWASAAKKPAGGWAWVFMIAVVPSERRSLVAADVSPPASGAVATTADAEEVLGVLGDDGLAGHVAGSACWTGDRGGRAAAGGRRRGRSRSVPPSRAPPRSLAPHRSTGPAPRHPVRRGRSHRRAGPGPARARHRPGCDAAYVREVAARPSRGPGRCRPATTAENCWARCSDGS